MDDGDLLVLLRACMITPTTLAGAIHEAESKTDIWDSSRLHHS
jgi:hypothetical protein